MRAPELAIVGDVRVAQQVVVRSHHGGVAFIRRAVDRGVLADDVVIADDGAGHAALPFQVLGLEAETGKRKNLVVLPDRGVAVHDDVRMQLAARSQDDVFADTPGPMTRPSQVAHPHE